MYIFLFIKVVGDVIIIVEVDNFFKVFENIFIVYFCWNFLIFGSDLLKKSTSFNKSLPKI